RPARAMTSPTARLTEAWSSTSSVMGWTGSFSASIARVRSLAVAMLRTPAYTPSPRRPKWSAVARPMPVLLPVTRTTAMGPSRPTIARPRHAGFWNRAGLLVGKLYDSRAAAWGQALWPRLPAPRSAWRFARFAGAFRQTAWRVHRLQPDRKRRGSGRNRKRSRHPMGGWPTVMPVISPLDLFQLALALIVALAYRRFLT